MCLALLIGGCGASAKTPPGPVAAPPPAPVVTEPGPDVEDFERAQIGGLPPGWTLDDPTAGYQVEAALGERGKLLQILAKTAARNSRQFASLKHPLAIARYRGKRVLVAARATCEAKSMWADLTIGANVTRPVKGYGDRVRTDEIAVGAWREYSTIVDVAPDASALDLVVAAYGTVSCQVDDLSARVLGPAGAGDEPPRALAGRALDNVVAFARLYGIVRYFHPSDEAAALDDDGWSRFVVRGLRAVESAPDAAALATLLRAQFAPIAPSVVIGEGAAPAAITGPAVHWNHHGLGITKESAYQSVRGAGPGKSVMTITMPLDPAQFRGKELKVKLRARGKVAATDADAGLWIAEQRADGKPGFYTEPEVQPAIGEPWSEIAVGGKITGDAVGLVLGVQAFGDADVWLESPIVTADGKPIAIAGWGTAGAELADQWSAGGEGFAVAVGGKNCDRRRACLHVSPKVKAPPDLRPWSGTLGGVAVTVPLELATKEGKTVPAARVPLSAAETSPLLASDRATRLAAVVVAWNVFEHFYPYFDVRGTDWMPQLPRALEAAALDDGAAALHTTLRRLVHELHDGHGYVGHAGEDQSRVAPWLWERVEGKVVITQVSDRCTGCDLAPGDVVVAIDGVPIEQAVAAAGALDSASTPQFLDSGVLRGLRRGPEGSKRTLTVMRGGTKHEVVAALGESVGALEEKRPATGDEIAPGIRYVDIGKVSDEQWAKIVPDLGAAKGVIIDVRGYPSLNLQTPLAHATKTAVRSAQWHIPEPARPDREGMVSDRSGWTVSPAKPFLPNVVFLTDGRAVSAAETFMGIVEAFKLGPIVGSATAGTNGNINPFTLPGGFTVSWTGMKVLKHDGTRHHGVGILPTVPAAKTIAGVAAGRDEILEKGISIAQQRAASKRR